MSIPDRGGRSCFVAAMNWATRLSPRDSTSCAKRSRGERKPARFCYGFFTSHPQSWYRSYGFGNLNPLPAAFLARPTSRDFLEPSWTAKRNRGDVDFGPDGLRESTAALSELQRATKQGTRDRVMDPPTRALLASWFWAGGVNSRGGFRADFVINGGRGRPHPHILGPLGKDKMYLGLVGLNACSDRGAFSRILEQGPGAFRARGARPLDSVSGRVMPGRGGVRGWLKRRFLLRPNGILFACSERKQRFPTAS